MDSNKTICNRCRRIYNSKITKGAREVKTPKGKTLYFCSEECEKVFTRQVKV